MDGFDGFGNWTVGLNERLRNYRLERLRSASRLEDGAFR